MGASLHDGRPVGGAVAPPSGAGAPSPSHPTGRLVLVLLALAPFDGLDIVLPLPAALGAWKQGLLALIVASTLLAARPSHGVAATDERERRTIPASIVACVALLALAVGWFAVRPSGAGLLGLRANWLWVLLPLAIWARPLSARQRDRLVGIVLVTTLVTAAVGLVQQAVGPEALHRLGYEWNEHLRFAGGRFRSISTFNQPFPFAYHLATGLLVVLPVALAEPWRRRHRLFLLASPLVVLAMLTTVVRGALVMSLVGLVAMVLLGERRVLLVLAPAVVVAAAGLAVARPFTSTTSLETRASTWSGDVPELVDRPLGQGLDASGVVAQARFVDEGLPYDDYTFSRGRESERLQPDSQFVVTGLTLGAPALVGLVVVLVGAAARARRASRDPDERPRDVALAVGLASAVVGAGAAMTVSTYLEVFPSNAEFWILIGVLACTTSSSKPSRSARAAVAASRPTSASS